MSYQGPQYEVPLNNQVVLSRGAIIKPLRIYEGVTGTTFEMPEARVVDIEIEEPTKDQPKGYETPNYYIKPEYRVIEVTVKLRAEVPII